MKTNHRRNFVARDDTLDNRIKHLTKKDSYLGLLFHATSGGHCLCCGSHGLAKDRRGAKKYVNSRIRFHTKQILKEFLEE